MLRNVRQCVCILCLVRNKTEYLSKKTWFTLLCCGICFVAIYVFCVAKSFVLQFTLFCRNVRTFYLEKNWAQKFARGERRTNIMYGTEAVWWYFKVRVKVRPLSYLSLSSWAENVLLEISWNPPGTCTDLKITGSQVIALHWKFQLNSVRIYLNVLCRPSSAGIRLEMTKAAGCLSTWRIALSESVPPCINFLETGNVWQCPLHLTYAISESVPCIKVERLEISNSVLCSIDQFCLQLNLLMTWHWLSSTNNRSWVGLVSLPFHPFMWKYVCVFFVGKKMVCKVPSLPPSWARQRVSGHCRPWHCWLDHHGHQTWGEIRQM